jgi:hypothetical protein
MKKRFAQGFGSLLLAFIFQASAPVARANIIQWTIQSLTMTGTFGTATATGYFDFGAPISDITVTETLPGSPVYTYTFTGALNIAPDYKQLSKLPPSCFNGYCAPPLNVDFGIDTVNILGPPGPWPINGSSFTDGVLPFGGIESVGSVVSRVVTPEPSLLGILGASLAVLAFANVFAKRRSRG